METTLYRGSNSQLTDYKSDVLPTAPSHPFLV